MKRFVKGILEVSGDCNFADGCLNAESPNTRKVSYELRLLLVSLDIETAIYNGNIFSIPVDRDDVVKKFFMQVKARSSSPPYLELIDGKAALPRRFMVCLQSCVRTLLLTGASLVLTLSFCRVEQIPLD